MSLCLARDSGQFSRTGGGRTYRAFSRAADRA